MFISNEATRGEGGARRVAAVAATIVGLLVLALLVAGCGGSGAATTTTGSPTSSGGQGAPIQVVMTNRSYDPATVTIKVGDTITWENQDAPQHDVVADNGEFKSNLFAKGVTFSYTFTKAGTYPYHCSIHPGMTGTVTVQ